MENDKKIKRFFLVGCPRSGTTLLQGMLASHSRVYSLPETFFFAKVLPRSWIKRHLLWPSIKLQGHLDWIFSQIGREDLLAQYDIGLFQRDYARPFVEAMDCLTLEKDKDIWLEKTPWHLKCITEISENIQGVKFVHIVRNGYDVVSSLYRSTNDASKQWAKLPSLRQFNGFSVEECVNRWNADMDITLKYVGNPNHIIIEYEKLILEPEKIMEDLCHFMGAEFEKSMLTPQNSFSKIVSPDEPWKKNNKQSILTDKKRVDCFTEEERAWIRRNLLVEGKCYWRDLLAKEAK